MSGGSKNTNPDGLNVLLLRGGSGRERDFAPGYNATTGRTRRRPSGSMRSMWSFGDLKQKWPKQSGA